MRHYYAFMGPIVECITQILIATSGIVKGTIQAFSGIEMDELIMWPIVPHKDQLDCCIEIVG